MITQKQACDYAELAYTGRNKGQGGYIWGSDGQLCTETMLTEWSRRAPDRASMIQTTGRKWIGKYVWDCSGLFRGMTRELGCYKSGGATTIFKTYCTKTGLISDIPDIVGVAVFKSSSGSNTNMSHIGIYVGNGMVIHAKGTAYGVIKEKLSNHPWTHWGELSYILYDDNFTANQQGEKKEQLRTLYIAKINTQYDAGLSLWNNISRSKSLISIKKGEIVEILDFPTLIGWACARYKDIEGYIDSKYLIKIENGNDNVIEDEDYTPVEANPIEILYKAKINTKYPQGLNLWDSPDKNKSLIEIKKDEIVEILNKSISKNFAYAKYKNIEGYIDNQYLTNI